MNVNQGLGSANLLAAGFLLSAMAAAVFPSQVSAAASYQTLPFSQDWSNPSLIAADADWSQVPGIVGYIGESKMSSEPDVDPRTLTADVSVSVDVRANQSDPSTLGAGGVAEFDGLSNRVVALQGSGPADAPFLKLHLNASQVSNVVLAYLLRDLDGSANNAQQQINAQYRLGSSGPWTNIAGSYVADATAGPNLSGLETPVVVALPAEAAMQPMVEIRIMTTNAGGFDEWVGVDDIRVTGDGLTASQLVWFDARPEEDGLELSWQFAAGLRFDRVILERGPAARGPWSEVIALRQVRGETTALLDRAVEPERSYFYRLLAEAEGRITEFGPFAATSGPAAGLGLSPPWPNPSAGTTQFVLALSSVTSVRLSVFDIQGREVEVLAEGVFASGRYPIRWTPPRSGIFFVCLRTPERSLVRRIAIGR